jgi:hypothetical protein
MKSGLRTTTPATMAARLSSQALEAPIALRFAASTGNIRYWHGPDHDRYQRIGAVVCTARRVDPIR